MISHAQFTHGEAAVAIRNVVAPGLRVRLPNWMTLIMLLLPPLSRLRGWETGMTGSKVTVKLENTQKKWQFFV